MTNRDTIEDLMPTLKVGAQCIIDVAQKFIEDKITEQQFLDEIQHFLDLACELHDQEFAKDPKYSDPTLHKELSDSVGIDISIVRNILKKPEAKRTEEEKAILNTIELPEDDIKMLIE